MTILRLVQISDLATTATRRGHLPVSPSTCWRWVKEGLLPRPFKLGPGTTVWDLDEVEAAIGAIKAKRARQESGVNDVGI
jgi:predicted DNA-binding transcriptional regulator AlpA